MKKNALANLILAIGAINLGIILLTRTGAYSYKYHMNIQFLQSPIKEIIGIGCILWGLYLAYLVIKDYIKQNK